MFILSHERSGRTPAQDRLSRSCLSETAYRNALLLAGDRNSDNTYASDSIAALKRLEKGY